MAGSFVENINLLASKLPIIEESNEIFDEDVVPILREISQLDIGAAIADLKKGNYLGNRKLDINLILNMLDVDEALLERNPDLAEAIWTDVNKAVHYDKATITFVDGVEIELPFMFDGSPVTVTTHGDLLAQFARLDYVYAKAQIDSIYQVTVGNSTDYTVTIDATPYTFTSDIEATRENIIAGIANMLNSAAVPVTALVTDNGTKLNLIAKVPGNPFYASVSNNMAINTIQVNVIEGPVETAFLAKLENTLAANFAEPIVGEIVRLYDIIGLNSNVERIRLNAVSGSYKTQAPEYYWANTTSAFQTLSMRANDIIKLGAEIDNIILLAKSIAEVIEIQKRIPQLVDTFDVNGNPNGDETIYNNLSELVEVHGKLSELITVYNDIKVGGTNYIQSVSQNLEGSNTIGVVATDLQLGVDSNIINTGSNIDSVIIVSDNITNVNTVATANTKIDLIVDTVIPNLPEILLADDNALIATNKALEATQAAAIATAKNTEMKNVSVGTTITGIPGTPANVTYNPISSKFTFVIPKGDKGDKGDAFLVNAIGLKASQSLYDSMIEGFSFLALDESQIYFKMSNTPGDWSLGSPFGKGDKGDKGNTGNSIVNTVFTSTTDPSGLPGQSGATDTYTINYDNLETDTFTVKNGVDGLNTVIDTLEFEVLVDDVDYTVNIDTTDGVFEVYFNGMLLPTSEYSLTGSTVTVNKPVVIGDEIIVKKIVSVDVLNTYSQTAINTKIIETVLQLKNYTDTSMATGNSATATKLHTPININGVSFDGSSSITVSDDTAVKLTGDQTIEDIKTFTLSPIVPTPTLGGDAVNKDYVDNNSDIGAITSYSQISGTNIIEAVEFTNNIHDIFGDGSCVATYQLNGNANDLGGTYNGTVSSVIYEEGKFGQAAKGTNGYIDLGTTSLMPYNSSYTVSAWVKKQAGTRMYIASKENAANKYSDSFFIESDNKINVNFPSGVVTTGISSSSINPITIFNDWIHIVLSVNRATSSFKVFMNGNEVPMSSNVALSPSYNSNLNVRLIGRYDQYYSGSIDQVRFFNRTLTQAEINTLYSETRFSANAELNINQGTFIYPKGLTSRGYVKSSDMFTGTVPTSSVSDGWKYVAKDENNNFSFYDTKPTLGKTSAELYLNDGKLYNSSDDTEITPISFLSNKVRFASGAPVELAPSGIAKSVTDSIEANKLIMNGMEAFACRAWANFSSTGVLTIKASANISSITDLGIGNFKPNFIESMPDINYDVSASTSYGTTNTASNVVQMFSNATTNYVAPTVSSFNFITFHPINSVVQDSNYVSFSVRR